MNMVTVSVRASATGQSDGVFMHRLRRAGAGVRRRPVFLYGTTVQGFPFLASIIAIFSGAQLLALGIIGEYLARMHFRMMERPTYTVVRKPPPVTR